jgi:predicted nucleic acid-binding Zn ribbon protein
VGRLPVSRIAPRRLAAPVEALTADLAPATTLARVQEMWERVLGPAIAGSARPTAERDGVLTVICEAAVWAQELDLMGGELIGRLNAELGEGTLRQLRCRSG